ncbi:MAG: SIR2 family protein [Fibrobacteraceae bacterium]
MANQINKIDWEKDAIAKIGIEIFCSEAGSENGENSGINWDDANDVGTKLRSRIEPWLTALVQSEHLSLLVGSGLSTAISGLAGTSSQGMQKLEFKVENANIQKAAKESAAKTGRGEANAEDVFRVAIELLRGLEIAHNEQAEELKQEISSKLEALLNGVLKGEQEFLKAYEQGSEQEKKSTTEAFLYLKSFLLSFTSRVASRDRLHIFTTNYDRFIEYAMDDAGILWLDRFRGMLRPVFRNSRLDLDFHYNPPGIRGEPRYVEGVSKITKLHGSLDWTFDGKSIHREPMPFGAEALPRLSSAAEQSQKTYKPLIDSVVVYPNSAKDMETAFYPYAELFRDFSAAICRPNSVVVTYGYGFGDDHINRVLQEMLTIPSTHLLVISWDKAGGRIEKFVQKCNLAQISLLLGEPFAELSNLVNFYLPKPGIDRITQQLVKIKENREKAGVEKQGPSSENSEMESEKNG